MSNNFHGMSTSESVVNIAAALLAAQKAITSATKEASNPYFKSKYADLSSVMGAVKGPLNDNGIVILQFPSTPYSHGERDVIGLTTRLQHVSGEFIEATAIVPLSKADPQAFGSAITYARRYSLQAAVGLLAEDDDGEAAVDHGGEKKLPATSNVKQATGFRLGGGPSKPTNGKAPAPARGRAGLFPTGAAKGEEDGSEE